MRKYTVLLAMLFATTAFAQAADPSPLDNPLSFVKLLFDAVTSGRWPEAASTLLVLFVALFRIYGRKVHDTIPDDHWADKPFFFFLESKPGGWLLNVLTGISGGIATAILAGAPISWGLIKPLITVSLTAAGLWGLAKDVMEWWQKKKLPDASGASAAGAAGAAKPPEGGLGR